MSEPLNERAARRPARSRRPTCASACGDRRAGAGADALSRAVRMAPVRRPRRRRRRRAGRGRGDRAHARRRRPRRQRGGPSPERRDARLLAQRDAAKTNNLRSERDAPVAAGESAPGGGRHARDRAGPDALQRYEAELSCGWRMSKGCRTRPRRLSGSRVQLGGSVASLRYDAPEAGTGAAQIDAANPTARVQSAIAQLTQLGTIIGQSFGIEDLQQQA